MTDDLHRLLRSTSDAGARPDHADIRRRGRRLVAVRVASLVGVVAVVATGVVGVALGFRGDDIDPPIIGEPPPSSVDTAEDAPDETIKPAPPVEPVGEVCSAPDLRPTYLPWLDDGEQVPEPHHVHQGTEGDPDGRLVWAQDPDRYDPTGSSETDMVSIASLADHEPSGHTDPRDVEVRGHPAELVWVGDPGIGGLSLRWSQRPAPCGTFAIQLLVTTRPEVPDYLDLERSFAEAEAADGVDAAMSELEQAIEAQILRIADSLVDRAP